MKNKYLVCRNLYSEIEIDSFDCYHSTDVNIAIPTEYIVELTPEEVKLIKHECGGFFFIPILSKTEVEDMIKEAVNKTKERAKRFQEQEARKKITQAKRKATLAKKREEKERKRLEELKAKFE